MANFKLRYTVYLFHINAIADGSVLFNLADEVVNMFMKRRFLLFQGRHSKRRPQLTSDVPMEIWILFSGDAWFLLAVLDGAGMVICCRVLEDVYGVVGRLILVYHSTTGDCKRPTRLAQF